MEDPKLKQNYEQLLQTLTQQSKDIKQIELPLEFLHDKIFMNIQNNPTEPKYRSIKLANKTLQEKLFCLNGMDQLLKLAGFVLNDGVYTLPDNKFMALMSVIGPLSQHINILRSWKHPCEQEVTDKVKIITDKEIQELSSLVQSQKPIIIDFWAEWCGPCRKIKPTFHMLSGYYKNVTYVSIEGDKNPQLANFYKIKAFPTFIIVNKGNIVETFSGANEDKLKQISQQLN